MQLNPLKVANSHRLVAGLVRQAFRATQKLARYSYRLGKLTETLFGSWRLYGLVDKPVTIHEGGDRYRENQIRVLLVTHELSLSGAPRIIAEIAGIFGQAGWLVTVVSPTDGPSRAAMRPHATVIIDPTILEEHSPLMRQLKRVTDLAICNTVMTDGAVCGLASRVPTLWYLHEVSLLIERLATEPQTMRAIASAHRVWAGSELPASLLRPYRGDVQVQPYGLQALPFVAADADNVPVRMAVFGAIEPRKGQDLALKAMAALSPEERGGIRLTFYGRVVDPAFAHGVALVADSIAEVSLGGELNSIAYATEMAATDVVLVSSRDDTLPLVSLDALGSGRLLMCTPSTGTSAWIADGESGFIATDTSAEAIAAMISRALARRRDWPSITRAGRVAFNKSFSDKAFARALLNTADTMLGAVDFHV